MRLLGLILSLTLVPTQVGTSFVRVAHKNFRFSMEIMSNQASSQVKSDLIMTDFDLTRAFGPCQVKIETGGPIFFLGDGGRNESLGEGRIFLL